MTLSGVDVSEYQGYVNWGAVRRSGRSFAVAKASEGLAYSDPTFRHNWPSMRFRGLARGAYCFLHPSYDPRPQVDHLHAYVRSCGGFKRGDYVLLDLEVYEVPYAEVRQRAEEFVAYARESIDKQVVLYSGGPFLDSINAAASSVLTSCPLHLAEWGVDTPSTPAGWPVVSFWQYTATGTCPGVSGQCDLDSFLGDESQLRKVLAF